MNTLQIRLPTSQVKKIDQSVKNGLYRSRSEAIRDALDRLEFITLMDSFQQTIERSGTDKKILLQGVRTMRQKLYPSYL